jgi:aspartate/methionine/tyrosine aminotransferase
LKEIGFEVVKPRGSFYIMPSVKHFGMTGSEFSTTMIKDYGVALVPGEIFGSYSEDRVRISYATKLELLSEAMDRIETCIKRL